MPNQIRTIARAEPNELPVLVRISTSEDDRLDLKLLATEGENKFRGKVKDKQINELRAETYNGPDDEWRAILRHSFRLEPPAAQKPNDDLQALEIVASLSGKAPRLRLTVTIRRKVSGISQKLGMIVLKQDEELEVNAIDWACEAVEEVDTLRSNMAPLETIYQEAQTTIESLEQKLDELLKAKKAHEEALIVKFAELLNEKKVKIRQQQRLLTTAKIDKKSLRDMQNSLKSTKQMPKAGRKSKRKAPEPLSASDSSEAFETTRPKPSAAGNVPDNADDSDLNRDTTQTESETESGTDDEDPRTEATGTNVDQKSHSQRDNNHVSKIPTPPPPRELPFTRKEREISRPEEAGPDSEETASGSDDEL